MRLDLRQEFAGDEFDHAAQPLRIGAEGRMHVEAVAAAGAGGAGRRQRRMAIGHEHHACEIAADQRLERRAQLGEVLRQVAIEDALRIRDRGDVAAAAEQAPLGARFDDDVGDQPGELDVVGADGEQHEVEGAVGALLARGRERLGQRRDLRAATSSSRRAGAGARAFADALRAEEAGCDGRAGAGERNEGDGDAAGSRSRAPSAARIW